uniref:Uncharacterized protein n=1 Tax=viral metagenome TaxID=1070528 RepID=A0A6C0CNB4_9ZZZZ
MELPENFISVMKDFTSDLKSTFPEHAHKWWIYGEETSNDGWKDLFSYCLKIYPERFFDILYQNEEMFKEDSQDNVDFLPRVDFRKLYYCEGVSSQTQQTIWKYLQLILFMVIGNVKDKSEFGNTMNLFEGIDETELQEKMTEAMSGLGDFFKTLGKTENDDEDDDDEEHDKTGGFQEAMKEGEKMMDEMFKQFGTQDISGETHTDEKGNDMPNADDIHSHLKGLFGGKLGHLAQELMEELTEDVQESLGLNAEDLENSSNPMDVLKKLMRRPDKLMSLVKKIQTKFQDKMNSGDLSQEDIMKEAGDMLRKMKEMGGNSKQMNEMFQNMAQGMGGSMGKDMKVDMNKLDRMMKTQDIKDRLRARVEKKKQDKYVLEQSEKSSNFVYRPADGEKQEKTILTDEAIAKIAEDIGDILGPPDVPKKSSKKNNKKKKKSNK